MKIVVMLVLAAVAATARAAPLTEGDVRDLRSRIRKNFLVPNPLPPPEGREHRTFEAAPGVKGIAVTYATEFGMRVPAILYLPDPMPASRIPAFIVVNGHGGDKYAWYSYYTGVEFARGGMAVLTFDQAGEGERNDDRKSGTREHDRLQGGPEMARRLCGLMLTDIMEAVSYLRTRPGIDPGRIGAGGYSLGSFVLSLAGAVEQRLRACVIVGGGNLDGANGYWDRSGKQMCQGLPYRSLDFLGDRPAVLFALQAARGPTLIWNGREDNVVNVTHTQEPFFDDLRRRVAGLHGSGAGVFTYGFTANGSHRPYWLTRGPVLWIERQLDFPNWTEASIREMPETLVGEWSRSTGFPIDRLYATDAREGGTLVVGSAVPGIARGQLSVFSPDEWRRRKDRYVFSVWARRARNDESKRP